MAVSKVDGHWNLITLSWGPLRHQLVSEAPRTLPLFFPQPACVCTLVQLEGRSEHRGVGPLSLPLTAPREKSAHPNHNDMAQFRRANANVGGGLILVLETRFLPVALAGLEVLC